MTMSRTKPRFLDDAPGRNSCLTSLTKRPVLFLSALVVSALLSTSCRALGQSTVLSVPSAAHATIQSALNAAVSGDTVLVAPGVYVENLVWLGQDIHLIGAGVGQTIVDGNQMGSCLTFKTSASSAALVSGFTFTNGYGSQNFYVSPTDRCGGGLLLDATAPVTIAPVIADCEILACSGEVGAAIFVRGASSPRFERLRIDGNIQVGGNPSVAGIIVAEQGAMPELLDCQIKNHVAVASSGFMIRVMNGSNLSLEGCSITGNSSPFSLIRMLNAQNIELRRCVIAANSILDPAGSQVAVYGGDTFVMQGCLVHGNTGGACLLIGGASVSGTIVQNCTIVDNTVVGPAIAPLAVFSEVFALTLENSIVRNNLIAGGTALPSIAYLNPPSVPEQVTHSNVSGYTGGTASIDTAISFVDPVNGDYRPLPGSAGIDAGTSATVLPLLAGDLRGQNRIAGAGVDMGCFEVQALGYHAAARGAIGVNFSGPFDVLKINGTSGGPMRSLSVPIGTASVVSVDQPIYLSSPANFVIFGVFGEASFASVLTVPFGIGQMMFAPVPMVPPFLQSFFFTFTDNFSPLSPQFIGSSPTPWASPQGPPIPFPLVITFQGVLEDGPGNFRPTNAILFRVE